MNSRERIQLWNWINEYAVACGGDTSDATISQRRMEAVARVEQTITEVLERLLRDGFPPIPLVTRCEPGYIDLPANPIIRMDEGQIRAALVDWMTRGNMWHDDKPDSRLPTAKEEHSSMMAEAKERAEKLDRATIEEQLEFVRKAIELGCHKYIGEPTYVGQIPERKDIPVEPKAPIPDKKVESATFSTLDAFEAVYHSNVPDDLVYEVVGKLVQSNITEPTPEVIEAVTRSVMDRKGKAP